MTQSSVTTPESVADESGIGLRGNFVMLRADSLRLLLPQDQVGPAEHISGLDVHGRATDERVLMALSSRLRPLAEPPPDRFLTTTLGDDAVGIDWCWSEVDVLIDVQLQPQALPAALVAPYTPVSEYVDYKGHIAFLCSAQKLCDFALSGL